MVRIKKLFTAHGDSVFKIFKIHCGVDFTKAGISTAKQRLAEIEKVAKFLKYDDYQIAFEGNQYHLKLDSLPQLELISAIEKDSRLSINKVKPEIILFPTILPEIRRKFNTSAGLGRSICIGISNAYTVCCRPICSRRHSPTKKSRSSENSASMPWPRTAAFLS